MEKLTPREWQIVTLVTSGATTTGIASRLGIGEQAVRNNLHQAFQKTGSHNRVQLSIWASTRKTPAITSQI